MKIVQWKIILAILIIGFCFVRCDNEKNDGKSTNNKKKCKNGNNGRGKGKGRNNGSGENDCSNSGTDSTIKLPEVTESPKFVEPQKEVESTGNENEPSAVDPDLFAIESDPLVSESGSSGSSSKSTESNTVESIQVLETTQNPSNTDPEIEQSSVASTVDSEKEEKIDDHTVSINDDNEDKSNKNEDEDPRVAVTFTPTPITTPVKSPTVGLSTPKPTKKKINKNDRVTKQPGLQRPPGCINCKRPPTKTSAIDKQSNGDKKGKIDNMTSSNKTINFGSHKPVRGDKNLGCFVNEHNYWFGIYLPNRVNSFYRPVNYFRSGQNYWYGLFLPNMQTRFPNGCSSCNQIKNKKKL